MGQVRFLPWSHWAPSEGFVGQNISSSVTPDGTVKHVLFSSTCFTPLTGRLQLGKGLGGNPTPVCPPGRAAPTKPPLVYHLCWQKDKQVLQTEQKNIKCLFFLNRVLSCKSQKQQNKGAYKSEKQQKKSMEKTNHYLSQLHSKRQISSESEKTKKNSWRQTVILTY